MPSSPSADDTNSYTNSAPETQNGHRASSISVSSLNAEPSDNHILADTGERFDRARQSAIKVYAVLIAIGIVIGGITLVGVVMLMQQFGLTEVPTPVDQQ